MPDTENKRVRRTTEERIAEIDNKIEELGNQIQAIEAKKQESIAVFDDRIAKVQARIEGLNKQKADILSPKPPRKPRKGWFETGRNCRASWPQDSGRITIVGEPVAI